MVLRQGRQHTSALRCVYSVYSGSAMRPRCGDDLCRALGRCWTEPETEEEDAVCAGGRAEDNALTNGMALDATALDALNNCMALDATALDATALDAAHDARAFQRHGTKCRSRCPRFPASPMAAFEQTYRLHSNKLSCAFQLLHRTALVAVCIDGRHDIRCCNEVSVMVQRVHFGSVVTPNMLTICLSCTPRHPHSGARSEGGVGGGS